MRGVMSSSGSRVTEATALNVAAVYTGVLVRSRLFSTMPLDIVETQGRSRIPRPGHPVARLLTKPNAWQTRSELLGMLEAHRLLRGNCYAWKNLVVSAYGSADAPAQVVELIPMHPDQVEVLDPADDFSGPKGYRLHKRNGQHLDLAPDEVLHVKGLSTDGRVGRSFMADMREAIGGALALREHANALWSRDATPSLALKHPKGLSALARKNLEESWEATYGRGKEKRRVAILEEGLEIQQLSITPEDGQFLQTDQDLRAQIAAALQVPPHLMGLSEKATSWGTGIEQQQIGFRHHVRHPDAGHRGNSASTRDLIAANEKYFAEFRVDGLMRGDINSRYRAYRTMRPQLGLVVSANDIRGFENENPDRWRRRISAANESHADQAHRLLADVPRTQGA
jgi:HK97 family phage portal protein